MSEAWAMTGEILLRVLLTWTTLLVLARLTGKKQLSQATFFDFITAIAVGDIAGENLANPEKPLLPWLAGTVAWFALTVFLDILVLKNRRLAGLVEGTPSVLIQNGKILEKSLRSNFLRVDDLVADMRKMGYFNVADVEFAVYETDGSLSVMPKSQVRPVTPKDLNLATEYEGLPLPVVQDGKVNYINLKRVGLDEEWLRGKLAAMGKTPDQVFYASLDTAGKLYVDGHQHYEVGPPNAPGGAGRPH